MKNSELNEHQAKLVAQVCRYLQEIHPATASLQALGARFYISPYHLQRTFKRATGVSPREYAENLRLEDFKANLQNGARITDAIYGAGFGSSSRLYEQSDEKIGMTPSAYRKGGAGITIFFSAVPCPLGFLLVAVTERGICKLSLGDAPEPLIADLEAEFAYAERIRDDQGVGFWVERVIGWLEGWQPNLDLPVDIRATAFQLKVWRALQAIPVGETRSYGELAAAIDQPSASRAVANACARNPVALVIPCHRIIRADKSLGGYRWGVERKRAILERERHYRQQG